MTRCRPRCLLVLVILLRHLGLLVLQLLAIQVDLDRGLVLMVQASRRFRLATTLASIRPYLLIVLRVPDPDHVNSVPYRAQASLRGHVIRRVKRPL